MYSYYQKKTKLNVHFVLVVICARFTRTQDIVFILISVCCRKWKDRHESSAPSGFSRFPAAEGDSDDDEEYEKERRKRSEYFCQDP